MSPDGDKVVLANKVCGKVNVKIFEPSLSAVIGLADTTRVDYDFCETECFCLEPAIPALA